MSGVRRCGDVHDPVDEKQPAVLVADKGYDSDDIRDDVEKRNAWPMIPMRKNRKVRKAVDMTIYTLRNMVER